MIKKEKYLQNYNKDINTNKKFDTNQYNNIKSNSPILSHQENNYFYNTKINHLILQGSSSVNRDQYLYEQPYNSYNSVYINYQFMENSKKNNNAVPPKSNDRSFYKKTSSLEKINSVAINPNSLKEKDYYTNNLILSKEKENNNYIGVNKLSERKKEINDTYSKSSFLEESGTKSKTNYNFNNKNNYNPFQVLNYLKKRKNVNNNLYVPGTKELNVENHYECSKLSNSGILKSNNNNIDKNKYITGSIHKNNNFFYNIHNNINKYHKNKSHNNIILNKSKKYEHSNTSTTGCRKIPLKTDKIGSYNIKSPGIYNGRKNKNKYVNNNNRINIDKRSGCKSPEVRGNFIGLKVKNNIINKLSSNANNSENGFYRKYNDSMPKSDVVINNNMPNKYYLNKSTKKADSNNVNDYIQLMNSNKLYSSLQNVNDIKISNYISSYEIGDNIIKDNEKAMKKQNDIYIKINPKKYKLEPNKQYQSPTMNNALSENKMKVTFNYKNTKNETINYSKLKDKIEEFIDILEQFYYNTFKNCYIYFIEKLFSYVQEKYSNRSVILRRLKNNKKLKESDNNIQKLNNSKSTNNINKNKKEIDDPRKKEKSPVKFMELQKSLLPSMMKINQDNYIEIFNDLFKKPNESFDNKKCRSPMVDKRRLKEEKNLLKDSREFETNKDGQNYDKYKTNTNVSSLYYPRKNNIKIYKDNKDSNNNSNCNYDKNYCNTNIPNGSFRGGIGIDSVKHILNNTVKNKAKQYVTDDNIDNEETNENNNENKKEINPKFELSNSSEQYSHSKNNTNNYNLLEKISNKRRYKKKGQSQLYKNVKLYSKPLLKKTLAKESDTNISDNINNKTNTINIKKHERNNNTSQTKINTSLSNNIITVNRSLVKAPMINQKAFFNNSNNKNKDKDKKTKFSEITIKNVSTKDKRLYVYIKYINISNDIDNKKQKLKHKEYKGKLKIVCTDTITIKGSKKHVFVPISIFNNEYDFDNANLENCHVYSISTRISKNNRYEYEKHDDEKGENNIEDESKNKKLNNEEENEDKSYKRISNSNSLNDVNNKINEDIKDSIIYLINYLQNMYNDNKKMILFNFFKNLRKIKTNALLHTSIKSKGKNNSKKGIYNSKKYYKNPTELKNCGIDKLNLAEKKKPQLDEGFFHSNFIGNKNNKNKNKNNVKSNVNNNPDYDTSLNKSNLQNIINNTTYNVDNNAKTIKENEKEKTTKNMENDLPNDNENKNDIKDKEKLKKMKLAKLGKLFKNLDQENNIISAIKEQFLEWSNNNNLDLGRSQIDIKNQNNNNKKYGIKTFDMQFMFKNTFNDDKSNNIKKYEDIINEFKKKLIIFSLEKDSKKRSAINKKESEKEKK